MTTFVDFVAATGTVRLTQVRDAHKKYGVQYSPAADFYGPLRRAIVSAFEKGWVVDDFNAAIGAVSDPKKVDHYERRRKGLVKWAGTKDKKKYEALEPVHSTWVSKSGLEVKIRPELRLRIDGVDHVIKLYFKADKLSKQKTKLSLFLLNQELGEHGIVGILDVKQGRLITYDESDPEGIGFLLESEAAAFATLWEALDGA
jgi:hypothetical protein